MLKRLRWSTVNIPKGMLRMNVVATVNMPNSMLRINKEA
jgi:hypothetical protein